MIHLFFCKKTLISMPINKKDLKIRKFRLLYKKLKLAEIKKWIIFFIIRIQKAHLPSRK